MRLFIIAVSTVIYIPSSPGCPLPNKNSIKLDNFALLCILPLIFAAEENMVLCVRMALGDEEEGRKETEVGTSTELYTRKDQWATIIAALASHSQTARFTLLPFAPEPLFNVFRVLPVLFCSH